MKYCRWQSGYTLIEVMAATAIFLIAVLSISGLMLQGYKAMGRAGGRSGALHSTHEEIEAVIQNLAADEEVVVEKQPYVLEFKQFGISIPGTLITVTKIAPGLPDGTVTYVTFVSDEDKEAE